jgi:hypothetical protein
MSWLSSFLHPGKGYEKGQGELDKYFGQANNYYDQAQKGLQPYNQAGMDQYSNLNDFIKNLMDPEALQNKWAEGYKESPSALQAEKMAQEHGLNAASSMGLMGSNTALNATQAGTTQIGLDDRQNYLDNLMQKYLAGAQAAQGVFGTGANAAGQMGQNAMNMGQNAMNMGQNSAQMAFGKQNAGGSMFGNLLGAGLGLAGSALGGPIGGALAKRWNLSGGA